jgi:predicted MPP superfamily phosphohydrolase
MPGDALKTLPPEIASGAESNDSPVDHPTGPSLTRRRFLSGAGIAAMGAAFYPLEISRHELEIVHKEIRIRRLPEAFHGYRIVQLSDIHLIEFTEEFFLKYAVSHINQLAPDMVLLTGDFVSEGPRDKHRIARNAAYRCGEILSALNCPVRYACLGNHDVNVGSDVVRDALTMHDVNLLVDQVVPIERDGSRIWLSGLNDGNVGPNFDRGIPRYIDAPLLLMIHEPDITDHIMRHPRANLVDLILSGHTHGGQVRLPFLPPLALPPLGKKYVEGLFRFNETQLYVNRGLGTVELPVRFNCPPEITHITLQPA